MDEQESVIIKEETPPCSRHRHHGYLKIKPELKEPLSHKAICVIIIISSMYKFHHRPPVIKSIQCD
jgi:hypothetical protein